MSGSAESLLVLFRSLPGIPPGGSQLDRLWAAPIPWSDSHFVAKGAMGVPALLIRVRPDPEARSYPIALEHLRVVHDARCEVVVGTEARLDVLTVISCQGADVDLQEYFLRVGAAFIAAIGPAPTTVDVNRALQVLTQLFRGIAQPARKTIQGLWAELLIIAGGTNSHALARAWHPSPVERFDFAAESMRLEIKSSANGRRRHYFRLEQLQGPPEITRCIGSLLVEHVGRGVSCLELLDRIRVRLADEPDLVLKVESIVAVLLGNTLPAALREEFSVEGAKASLAFFEAASIPGSELNAPPMVEEIRFLASLEACEPMNLDALKRAGSLFEAAVPL